MLLFNLIKDYFLKRAGFGKTLDSSDGSPSPHASLSKTKLKFTVSHTHQIVSYWKGAMCVLTFAVCTTEFLRLGFSLHKWRSWVEYDIICTLMMFSDVVLNCFLTYEDEGDFIKDQKVIRDTYIRSWLIPDLFSAIPLEFLLLFGVKYSSLLRVNELIRLGRMGKYLLGCESRLNFKPSVVGIAKSIFYFLFLSHVAGCAFAAVILYEGDEVSSQCFSSTANFSELPLGYKYMRSFYWGYMTDTAYNNTNPNTILEGIVCAAITMAGVILFATVIGQVGKLVTNLDSSKLYFRMKLDSVNDFMTNKNIPVDLQQQVQDYYDYLWKSGKGVANSMVLEDLTPYLKKKMSMFLNKEIITKVPMFSQLKDDNDFIAAIVGSLKNIVALPNTFVVRKGEMGSEMFFVCRGELNVVTDEGKVVFTITDGGFFGEIALIYETKRTAHIVARTYCDMFIFTKDAFNEVKERFPDQVEMIEQEADERRRTNEAAEKKKKEEKAAATASLVHKESSTKIGNKKSRQTAYRKQLLKRGE